MTYTPNPIDTSNVQLSSELQADLERLAESTHDIWAIRKIRDGYRYGEKTDTTARTHTDLVPYVELPEGMKDYDRDVVKQTILALLALGYRIEKP